VIMSLKCAHRCTAGCGSLSGKARRTIWQDGVEPEFWHQLRLIAMEYQTSTAKLITEIDREAAFSRSASCFESLPGNVRSSGWPPGS
jgi:hypothetical protein